MNNLKKYLSLILLCTIISGCQENDKSNKEDGIILERDAISSDENLSQSDNIHDESKESTDIYVYVCGEVKKPGVYVLNEGSRVFEAVDMAGGSTKKAMLDGINQAQVLTDGQMLDIPSVDDEPISAQTSENENVLPDSESLDLVNINTASSSQLMTLSGIGESRAADIIAYRQEHGNFKSIEELKNVTGIKDGVFNKIKDYISVN